ncbi:centromere-associated protein E-like [Callorhinchus milii]|uniref:centromere-associated protein E-like n=1 Tax=Callorhinchus milii TaxID=7868 RepID=UPI001C3FC9ED|nr:centromere-associated protein E-like [Callorhinchus milii]
MGVGVTSETLAQAMEKAQLLAEKQGLQQEHEHKMKNLARMLVTASTEENWTELRARRKRRVTWAPGKLKLSLYPDSVAAKRNKLDDIFQELDETEDNEDFWDSGCSFSTFMDSTTEYSDTKRGGRSDLQNISVPDMNDKRKTRSNHCNCSESNNGPSNEELVKMYTELEQNLEDVIKERREENRKSENHANHLQKQLIESVQLCELLYSEKNDAKILKMEIEKQKQEISELKNLMKGKKEIEEFEYLEKEIQNITETEIISQAKKIQQDQQILDLQNQIQQLKEAAARNLKLYTCTAQSDGEDLKKQIVQLQQSLNDAEILICDGNKHSAFLRSENAQMKEEMNEMRMNYQQMEKDTQLYRNQLDAERTRYNQMQTDMQKELQHVFIENTKLTTLMDGKVPKNLLDCVQLEKTISELQQQLAKTSEEKTCLQQEVNRLCECKSLPDEVEKLTTPMAESATELCILTEEKDKLLAEREEYKNKYEELTIAKGQLYEELMAAQSRLKESKHELNGLNNQCKQLQLQLSTVVQETDQMERDLTGLSSEKDELRNDKQEKRYQDGCGNRILENECLNPDQSTVIEARNEIEVKELKEQLYSLQQNMNTLRTEKEQLQQERASLQTESEQMKCDLQESIEMAVENQAEMRNLQEELNEKQKNEIELKQCLSEKDHTINKEKQKTLECKNELQQVVSQRDHLLIEVEQQRRELITNVSKAQILDQEFNHQAQQLENAKSSVVLEKDELQLKKMESVQSQRDAMEKTLCEKVEMEICYQDGCGNRILENECLNPDQSTVIEARNEIEVKELKEQLYSLQQNMNTLRTEKEQLQQERASLQTESEQMKCDLQESIEMAVENQAEMRNLQEELIVKQKNEIELKQCLSEKGHTINEEKQKTLECKNELQQVVSQRDHLLIEVEQQRRELITNVSKAQILDQEFNHQAQQLENAKSSVMLEKDELLHKLESVQSQRDAMEKTLCEKVELEIRYQDGCGNRVLENECLNADQSTVIEARNEIEVKELKEQLYSLQQNMNNLRTEKEQLQQERANLQTESEQMKCDLQESIEMAVENQAEMRNLQEELKVNQKNEIELKQSLSEKDHTINKEKQKTLGCKNELQQVVSQRDHLLIEVEQLRRELINNISKAQILDQEFNHQVQQLENAKSSVVLEKDELQHKLESVQSQRDAMEKTLCEMEIRYQDGCGNHVLENECLNPDQSTVIEARNEIEVKELKEQLYSLQQNMNTLRTEKEQLQQERASLQTESEQMKCDLQESIEMAVENQAEMRNLQEELKVNQKNEIELKQSLSEKDHTINKEKQKTLGCKNELQQVVSQRDHLLIEVEQLRRELINNISKAQILDQEFNHQVQQLENAKSSVVLEKDELQHKLESVQSQRDAMEKTLCEMEIRYQDGCGNHVLENQCLNPDQSTVIEARNEIEVKELKEQLYSLQQNMNTLRTEKEQLQQERASLQTESEQMKCDLQESIEMAVENQAEMRNLQEELKVNQKNEIELKQSLSEKDHTINKEKQKTLGCKNELQQVVSQRDHLLIEVEQLRRELINNISKAQILDQEFNHQVQQLENAKSSVVLEKDELQHKLESVQSQRDAMEKTLCEMEIRYQDGCGNHVLENECLNPDQSTVIEARNEIEVKELKEQLYSLQQNMNTLRTEKKQLQQERASLQTESEQMKCDLQESIEMAVENQAEMRNLQEELKVKQKNEIELKQYLSEKEHTINEEKQKTLECKKELQQVVSQRDHLLIEVEQQRRELITNISKAQILDQEFNHQVQQLENAKSSVVLEKDELQHKLESVQSQRDAMEKTLCEKVEMTLECKNELQQVVSQRDHLLIEVEQLRCELINNVSKAQILDQEFNHQVQQLENAKSSVVLEKDELQHKLESVQSQRDAMEKTLCEKVEMVVTTERRNQEQAELVSVLEKQIATLKQRLVDSETSQSENNGIETDLSCHLQEKELLLQSTTQDFVEIKSKYSIRLSNSDKELSQEREKWRDLLAGFLSEATENVTLSKTIEELQRENLELHEQYQTWSLKFTISLSTVPYHQNKFVTLITKIDADLVKEHREQKELLVQLRALNSDSANLPLPDCEERNSEIRRLSSLLENKEQQLQETKQNLSELDSKYQNYLTITETELQFEINARKELLNHSSNHSSGNISSTIERIKHENKRLQEETELLKKTVLSTVKIFSPMWDSRNKFIINSNLQLADQRRKNKELLLQIQALRERESTENRCDPLQTVEDQELPRKFEQAIQDREMKIGKLEIALEMSREKCKLQENKILALQTEFSSKPLDKKVEALQAELVRKNDQIQDLLKATTQLQVSVDKCTEPFKQEIIDLKNRCSKLDLEKISETKRLEQQVSSLTASSRHKDELLGNMKRELRRNQTQQNISYVDQTEEAICSSDSPTTCGSGSGIVQSALVLVLQSENAKLEREVTQLRRKNQSLSSSAAEWEGEIRKWKGKLARKEEVRALDLKSEDVNVPSTLLLPLKQQTSSPQKVPPSVEVSTSFQGQTQSFDSSESRFFNLESQSRLSHPSKFFDNSGLGSLAGESPQKNPEKNDRKDWWKKSSSAAANDVQCKTQ